MKKALVLGGGGFIGNAMVERLIGEGFWVRAVDLKGPDFSKSNANEFILGDLRDVQIVRESLEITDDFDEIYQFAADMGGAGFVFTGENDAEIMHNSAKINLNVLEGIHMRNQTIKRNKTKIFYSSSACMYPEHNQMDPLNPNCTEDSAYPANPDSEYGWEKLFPAALCRKIAKVAGNEGEIEIWGDGEQTRSFLYIDECIEATRRLMASNFQGPVNIGSEEMVTINQLVRVIAKISNKKIKTVHVLDAPTGVRGRNSDNRLIREKLGWDFSMTLEDGLKKTYSWINNQIQKTSLKI